jgi:hypothetical protein
LIQELASNVDGDGYLIRSTDGNKYRKRGDAIGKRFTRLDLSPENSSSFR